MSSSVLLLLAALCVAAPTPHDDDDPHVLLTREEALALAFPECEVSAESLGLKKAELARVGKLAGTPHERRLVRRHLGHDSEGELVGTAYVDVHRVRTLRESLLVVVDPEGRVARIEVLAFAEPKAYLARAKWLAQFTGRELNDELSLKGEIRGIAGATLTARATTDAVRRVLAIHRVLEERPAPEPDGTPPKETPPKTPPERGGGDGNSSRGSR